jgi:hypothetical protein
LAFAVTDTDFYRVAHQDTAAEGALPNLSITLFGVVVLAVVSIPKNRSSPDDKKDRTYSLFGQMAVLKRNNLGMFERVQKMVQ